MKVLAFLMALFYNSKMNKKILAFLIVTLLCTPSVSFAALYDAKLTKLEKKLPDKNAQRAYENTLNAQAKYFMLQRNYKNASVDLMSALYFMQEGTGRYKAFSKRLNKAFKSDNFNPTVENKVELAKTLFYEKKYYASGWLFKNLITEEYEKDVCYEYLGDISFIKSNYKKAQEYYLKSLDVYSSNPPLKLKLAMAFDKTGNETLAIEQYRQLINITEDKNLIKAVIETFDKKIQTDSNNANNYEILADAYAKNGNYDKPYALYKKAIELKPDDVFLKYVLGGFLHQMDQNKAAIDIYNSILDDDIYESQIRIGKAKCLEKLGQTNEAIKEYQTVLIFYPESKQAQLGVYELLKGKLSHDKILESFYPLNNKFVPNAEFLVDFADFLASTGRVDSAKEFYNLAFAKYPKNKIVYTRLYNFYELTGKSNSALYIIKKANEIFPNDSEVLSLYTLANKNEVSKKNTIAQNYIKNKDYTRAIQTYKQIIPQDAKVQFKIANCYKSMKNYQKTIEYYKKGLSIEPKNFEGLYSLSMLYFENNDFDNAYNYLNKALSVDSKNIGAKRMLAVITQKQVSTILDNAYNYFNKKDYKKTNEILTAGLKKYPKNTQLYYYRALSYEAQKNYTGAISDLENAIKYDKTFVASYYTLGKIFELTNKKKEALRSYELFLSNDPEDVESIKKAQKRVDELTRELY